MERGRDPPRAPFPDRTPAGACADIWLCKLGLKHRHNWLLAKPLPPTSDRAEQHRQTSATGHCGAGRRHPAAGSRDGRNPSAPDPIYRELQRARAAQQRFSTRFTATGVSGCARKPCSPLAAWDQLQQRCQTLVVAWPLSRSSRTPPAQLRKHHLSSSARSGVQDLLPSHQPLSSGGHLPRPREGLQACASSCARKEPGSQQGLESLPCSKAEFWPATSPTLMGTHHRRPPPPAANPPWEREPPSHRVLTRGGGCVSPLFPFQQGRRWQSGRGSSAPSRVPLLPAPRPCTTPSPPDGTLQAASVAEHCTTSLHPASDAGEPLASDGTGKPVGCSRQSRSVEAGRTGVPASPGMRHGS